jgi:hypothetical protein
MKVSGKMISTDDHITINLYDNGYMLEVSGRDSEDEWVTSKILCDTLDKVFELITEISTMKRN